MMQTPSESHDDGTQAEDAHDVPIGMTWAIRLGGWCSLAGTRAALKNGLLSVLAHGALLVIALLVNVRTDIVNLEMQWSSAPLTGIGSSEAVATLARAPDQAPLGGDVLLADSTELATPAQPPPAPADIAEVIEPVPAEPETAAPAIEPAVDPPSAAEPAVEPPLEAEPTPEPPLDTEPPPDNEPAEKTLLAPVMAVDEPDAPPAEDTALAVEPANSSVVPSPEPKPLTRRVAASLLDQAERLAHSAPAPASQGVGDPTKTAAQGMVAAVAGAAIGKPLVAEKTRAGHAAEYLPSLDDFGPGNARLTVVVRTDRMRGSPFEESLRALLTNFPDFQLALGKSGVDPIDAFDAFLVATPNVFNYGETFLAVRHTLDEKVLKLTIKHSFPAKLSWTTHRGRPLARPERPSDVSPNESLYARSIYLPEPGLALILPHRFVRALDLPAHPPQVLTREPSEVDKTLLETLHSLETLDGSPDVEAGVYLQLRGIERLRFGAKLPELPAPLSLAASLTPSENPRVVARLAFADEATAAQFVEQWPAFVAASAKLTLPGLSDMLDAMIIERHGTTVYADGQLNGLFVKLLMASVSMALPELDVHGRAVQ